MLHTIHTNPAWSEQKEKKKKPLSTNLDIINIPRIR